MSKILDGVARLAASLGSVLEDVVIHCSHHYNH